MSVKEISHQMRNSKASGLHTTPVLFPGRMKVFIMPVLPSDGGSVGKKSEGRSSCDGEPAAGFRSSARRRMRWRLELGAVFWSTPFVVLVAIQLLAQLDKFVSSRTGRVRKRYTRLAHRRTSDQSRLRQKEHRYIQVRLSASPRELAKT